MLARAKNETPHRSCVLPLKLRILQVAELTKHQTPLNLCLVRKRLSFMLSKHKVLISQKI